ncbi:MAG: hypothetical protein IJC61_03035 [Oscillospiraceae bacterium]|nr:hypothetical protein [Oscillospiraceae bacterium]
MLKTVTFTGIDIHTDPAELAAIQRDYPFAEFGMLIAHDWRELPEWNEPLSHRFPDPAILEKFEGLGLNLSLHVCRALSQAVVVSGEWDDIRALLRGRLHLFRRAQLNNVYDLRVSPEHWKLCVPEELEQIILQQRSCSKVGLLSDAIAARVGCNTGSIVTEIDASAGTGVYDAAMGTLRLPYVGYAGGLCPENVVEFVQKLEADENVSDYWIDMETRVRENNWFSARLIREVCEKVAPFVGK